MSEILVGSIAEASDVDRPVAVLRRRDRRRDRRQRRRALGRGLLRRAATRWTWRSTSRSARARRSRCSPRRVLVLLSFVVGPFPMALVFNGFELGRDPPRGADRQRRSRTRASRRGSRASSCSRSTPCSGSPSSSSDARRRRVLHGPAAVARARGVTVVLLWVDLHFFARGREPTLPRGRGLEHRLAGRLAARRRSSCSCSPARDDAVTYTTVYFIERSLSLDNLFVFLLLFAYFGVPEEYRARLLFWGIAAALVLRGAGDPRRRRADRAVPLRHLRARRAAARARLPDPARRRGERRPRPQLRRAAGAAGVPGHRRLPRQALVRARDGRALRDAAVRLPGGDRRGRHRVRGRLDPGRVRDHARLRADLDGATSSPCSACARCSCSSRG